MKRAFVVGLLGILAIWIASGASGIVAQIILAFGVLIIIIGPFYMVPFPTRALSLARRIWYSFSLPAMRAMGVFAVAIGAGLIYYGVNL